MIIYEIKELNLSIGQKVFVLHSKTHSKITGGNEWWYYIDGCLRSYDNYGVARTTNNTIMRLKQAMVITHRIIPL